MPGSGGGRGANAVRAKLRRERRGSFEVTMESRLASDRAVRRASPRAPPPCGQARIPRGPSPVHGAD